MSLGGLLAISRRQDPSQWGHRLPASNRTSGKIFVSLALVGSPSQHLHLHSYLVLVLLLPELDPVATSTFSLYALEKLSAPDTLLFVGRIWIFLQHPFFVEKDVATR